MSVKEIRPLLSNVKVEAIALIERGCVEGIFILRREVFVIYRGMASLSNIYFDI